jgi:proteasome lid subunit RPN8/RPN11
MKLSIPSQVLAGAYAHGAEAFPAEGCGFLLGRWQGLDPVVDEIVRAENTQAENRNDYFEIDPRQYRDVEKSLRGTGRQIMGFYHSHPNHPDVPSFTDLNFAKGWPGFLWMIIQVIDKTAVSQQTYMLSEEGDNFVRLETELERVSPPPEKVDDYRRMEEILAQKPKSLGERIRRKVYLSFSKELIQRALVWELAQKFDVVTNIRHASVSGDVALVGLGLEGTAEEIKRGLAWMEAEGVRVEPIELGIVE